MRLTFNDLLLKAGVDVSEVRLLRHQTKAPNGRTPYLLWRDERKAFDAYQSVQIETKRSKLAASWWASFVVPPPRRTPVRRPLSGRACRPFAPVEDRSAVETPRWGPYPGWPRCLADHIDRFARQLCRQAVNRLGCRDKELDPAARQSGQAHPGDQGVPGRCLSRPYPLHPKHRWHSDSAAQLGRGATLGPGRVPADLGANGSVVCGIGDKRGGASSADGCNMPPTAMAAMSVSRVAIRPTIR